MEEKRPVSKTKKAKFDKVDALAAELEARKIVAILDMKGMPGKNLCQIRNTLRGKAVIKMDKRSVMKFALEKTSKRELVGMLGEQPALLLADGGDPFKLYRTIAKNRSPAPARAGKVTSKEIVVPKGDTGLPPGPVVGDLQKAGLPAKIQGGKIVIDKDVTVAKAGDVVKKDIAEALIKLGIEPFEIQLNVVSAWENGLVIGKDMLELAADDVRIRGELGCASSEAFALALECAWPSRETIKALLGTAGRGARAVSMAAGIVTKDNVGEMLALAQAQASAIKVKIEG